MRFEFLLRIGISKTLFILNDTESRRELDADTIRTPVFQKGAGSRANLAAAASRLDSVAVASVFGPVGRLNSSTAGVSLSEGADQS